MIDKDQKIFEEIVRDWIETWKAGNDEDSETDESGVDEEKTESEEDYVEEVVSVSEEERSGSENDYLDLIRIVRNQRPANLL